MSGKKRPMIWAIIAILAALAMGVSLAWGTKKVPRMTKEQLKEMLGKPETVILDVRATGDWDKAQMKIKGAVRADPNKATETWAEKYGKDKTIILYCA
jgi:hypothetical protein